MTAAAAGGLGLLIGLVLGALGGGGAILTVPALVYLLGESAQEATTSSLVIVGLTAVVGMAGHARSHRVRWGTGAVFGGVGVPAAFAGSLANRHVEQHVLLLGFAALMAVAAIGMLAQSRGGTEPCEADGPTVPSRSTPAGAAKVVAAGLAVGFLTGFLGVGGGFLIVPALVLAVGLPMPAAVGTSLLVIAVNSAASLLARTGSTHYDWAVITPFTLAAMVASLAGKRVADRLPPTATTRAFAALVLLVAAFIGVRTATG
ncbi:sulfite exporter TauE/SafE family protein [Micromonospora sp. WMMA1998]|uniref:sulfite exporter TauE/SafE family protein n=1 Tax=Micromonospora sp. WMMA1998 TaxID=3015167 RepID=UPI00248C400A|nr:sulfite exporter TauE/SafE family protein [Micromonospora sp. WMMA1998]WBC16444.1 sulfite exporter TauE/SafE family protein [Micromonospora sp. WMMA1998]